MFCMKCGEAIPDNSKICPLCGADLEGHEQQAVVYASQKEMETTTENVTNKKTLSPKTKRILAGVAILAVVVIAVLGVQKSNLKKELQKDWLDTDGTILKVLEFSDDEVEYRLETGYSWIDTTLFTEKYKVVSGNKIKVQMFGDDWETYTIEFNDDKTIMTVSPAMTSTDKSENWYYLD